MPDESPAAVAVTRLETASPGQPQVPGWFGALSDLWEVGVVVLGSDGVVSFASAKAYEVLGCRGADEFERTWLGLKGDLDRVVATVTPTSDEAADVFFEFAANGDRRRVHALVYPLADEDCAGHLLLLQSAERARANEMSLRSAARDRGVSAVYRDFAHDIKGSLNAMALNVALLQHTRSENAANPLEVRCLTALENETQRLGRAISSLLDRSAIGVVPSGPVDLAQVLALLADLVRARCDRQHVDLLVETPGEGLVVEGHADELHGAVLNLVINALDAMPDGGTLTLRAGPSGAAARISVCDTGPGVPEGLERRMWQLHVTTKPEGTGIGLHVTRAVFRAHGGSIRYARADGRTCFIGEIPLSRVEER
jgi:signal transduction histidine kinase